MAPKRRGVPGDGAGAGEPAAKRARGEEEGELTGVRFKALLRDPSTAGKGEGLAVGTPLWGRGGGGHREGQVMEPPSPAVGWLQAPLMRSSPLSCRAGNLRVLGEGAAGCPALRRGGGLRQDFRGVRRNFQAAGWGEEAGK